ncbi:type II toxin-antitoxin system RelE family toxin [Mycobacteroides chelonae]
MGVTSQVSTVCILYTINESELLVLIVKVGQRGGVYG